MIRINRRLPTFFVGMVMILWPVVPAMANESLYSYLSPTGGGSGIPTLQKGQVNFYRSLGGFELKVTMDYAIFAPGTYSSALGFLSLPMYDPITNSALATNYVLKSTDYVYAYQIHNLAGSVLVSGFTMPHVSQIDYSEYSFGYSNPATGPFTGNVNPSLSFAEGSSAIQMVFFLSLKLLPPGQSSYVFLVACPYYDPDNLKPVTVADSGLANQQNMPVPVVPVVPVPGALTLAAMGLGTIFFGRLRQRFV